jgi:hypothetical protein
VDALAADLPIDVLVLLIGYAISGERRLSDFFERLAPFGPAFMALFGRAAFLIAPAEVGSCLM